MELSVSFLWGDQREANWRGAPEAAGSNLF